MMCNESRADVVEEILEAVTDGNGPFADLSDLLANIRHFCARAGVDPNEVWDHSRRAAEGDLEPGSEAARDFAPFSDDDPNARSVQSPPETSSLRPDTPVRCAEDSVFDDEWDHGAASDRAVAYFVRGRIVNDFLDVQDDAHGAWQALLRLSDADAKAALATEVLWRFRCVTETSLADISGDFICRPPGGGLRDESNGA